MDIKNYLDSTYLKTAAQAQISEEENTILVENCIQEAITYQFKLVMVRPEQVKLGRKRIETAHSKVAVGTVIDFPNGDGGLQEKLAQAQIAITNGADELDFVVDYVAFKKEKFQKVKDEVVACSKLALENNKICKWILEVAALDSHQIAHLSAVIKNTIIDHFKENEYHKIFVKSSTGFYKTPNGVPNGATIPSILLLLENAFPLPVKASGGIKSRKEVEEYLQLGVKRIGTSAAKAIVLNQISNSTY